ncbi:MAG: nucleoside triphosphate pyrophosphohydrolase [Rudaea sp.]|uniref:nucleoside triphosphate pyrophosphohydrolase n=1 Tax=Rudaea sp. TaxID=2136325 RepID=UPI0039E4EA0B
MANTIDDLLRIMATLRDPERGCPWDVKQNFATIAPYTIEEAYEVADAIDRKDYADLSDELGDLLLQVVFHARMAEEAGHFAFADVVEAICAKMVRRHPHVFPDADGKLLGVEDADAQTAAWEELKRRERAGKGEADTSVLAGIARGLPEWQRAHKLQKRAATIGFDWTDPGPVLDKLEEEIGEVRSELAAAARIAADDAAALADNRARLVDEVGDVLFVAVNLARLTKIDYSQALRAANAKFERRFRRMEALAAAENTQLDGKSLAEQDAYWNRAKAEDKAGLL